MPRIGEIVGLAEFNSRLDQMTDLARKSALVYAVGKGGRVIQSEISTRAKRRTGKLAANIAISVRQATGTQAVARIGPSKSAFYGKFAEIGTKFQNPFIYIRPSFESKFPEAFAVALEAFDFAITKRGF